MSIKNAAPRAILQGIQDLSVRAPLPDPLNLPQHLPYYHILAERGTEEPMLLSPNALLGMYGSRSFDYRDKFANHATAHLATVAAEGNAVMVRRVIPQDAAKATLRLSLEVVVEDVPQYTRNADGTYALDVDGNPIDAGSTVDGYKVRWVVSDAGVGGIGGGVQQAGALTGRVGETSNVYPILDLSVSSFGAYGNNVGLRLSSPTVDTAPAVNDDLVAEGAYPYRLQFVERPDAQSSPFVSPTLSGEQFVDFTFKEGMIDKKVDRQVDFAAMVTPSYRDVDTSSGLTPVFGPMDETHVYQSNIEEVLGLLLIAEEAVVPMGREPHAINFVGGHDENGAPYYAIQVVGPADGGALMSRTVTHYAEGGVDGDLTLTNFDTMVGNLMDIFDADVYPLMDDAKYPFSTIWDSGFTLDTKKKLLKPMGLRKDVNVFLSTQDVSEVANSASDESSIAVALRAAARMYPESEVYGTPVCRAVVVGHCGYLTNSPYKGLVPMTFDVAQKIAKYMGASDGNYKPAFAFDQSPLNQVSSIKAVNNPYKPQRARSQDWDAGLVWVQSYDHRSLFFPAFQTVYDNDTSVLNSVITMMIATELEKVCQRVWRDLTGNTKLTNAQFIERSNRLITDRTHGRFDGRVVIIPETIYTEDDSARGYSWSCKIHMYANNMKTVGSFTVVAHRREELN